LILAMSSADEHLKLAAECAALASAAQWPETRKVWLQVEALYRAVAEHEARMGGRRPGAAGPAELIGCLRRAQFPTQASKAPLFGGASDLARLPGCKRL
jgi:hypothetical protein